MKKYPKYLIRPDDGEVFVMVGGGMYQVRALLNDFPKQRHHKYPFFTLRHAFEFIPAEDDEELEKLINKCFHPNRKFHSRDGDYHDTYKCLDCGELFSVRL